MARIRSVKPGFWNDEKIGQEPETVMLTFIGLWTFSDDYAVVRANPLWLKNQIFPYKDKLRIDAFSGWLNRLVELEAVIPFIYRGESYYCIRTFRKHQKPDRPSKARNCPEVELMLIMKGLGYELNEEGEFIKHSMSTRRVIDEHSLLEEEEYREGEEEEYVEAAHSHQKSGALPNEPETPPPVAPPPSHHNGPPLEEVVRFFRGAGGTEEMARAFWNKWEATGWMDGYSKIRNWAPKATNYISNWLKNEKQNGRQTNKQNQQPTGVVISGTKDYGKL